MKGKSGCLVSVSYCCETTTKPQWHQQAAFVAGAELPAAGWGPVCSLCVHSGGHPGSQGNSSSGEVLQSAEAEKNG